jgi:hypothetical protein
MLPDRLKAGVAFEQVLNVVDQRRLQVEADRWHRLIASFI